MTELRLISRALKGSVYIEQTDELQDEIERMEYIVCDAGDLKKEVVFSKSRIKEVVICKHIIIYYLHSVFGLTKSNIGRKLKLDHSTIIHALNSHDSRVQYDREYREVFERSKVYVL